MQPIVGGAIPHTGPVGGSDARAVLVRVEQPRQRDRPDRVVWVPRKCAVLVGRRHVRDQRSWSGHDRHDRRRRKLDSFVGQRACCHQRLSLLRELLVVVVQQWLAHGEYRGGWAIFGVGPSIGYTSHPTEEWGPLSANVSAQAGPYPIVGTGSMDVTDCDNWSVSVGAPGLGGGVYVNGTVFTLDLW